MDTSLRLGRRDPLGIEPEDELNMYKSSSEALTEDVLPRSRPDVAPPIPKSGGVSLSSPPPVSQSETFAYKWPGSEPAMQQPKQEATDGSFAYKWPGSETVEPVAEAKPKKETGDTGRGFTTALEQTPALAYGALGFAGAAGEEVFGAGGAMTSLKNFGLREYQTRMKAIGETAKESDDVTRAWAKAQQGDLGALVDWAQYGVGYLGGNIVETVATSALGSVIGGMTTGPVGAVAGAGAGAVGKQAVQGVAKNLIEGMVAKEAAKLAEKQGIELATDQMVKQATKTVAKNIGSGTALVGSGIIKETGGIYGEAEEQARAEGRELTGGDLARIFGSGVVAGLSEAAVDRLGLDVAAGKINIPGAGRPGRALIGGVAGVGIEGGQELFQTAIERFGAGKDLAGEDAMNEYINAFALGGLGGGTIGAAVGAFRGGKTDANRVRQILDQAQSDLTSDDGRQELFDAMFDDEKIGPILQANGIESGDDPRFQNVLVKALATQRMLVDLEAPTPEARAETRKQREADILAAFGETASTAIGASTGAIEPVIQRSSVTPNLETRTLEGEAQPVILPETTGGQAGTVALSPEDLAARREGFEPLVGIQTEAGPVSNRFSLVIDAVEFLDGVLDPKTQKRSGGYAQAVLDKQGLEARIRRGKQSAAEGGGTFYFIETRKKPEAATPAATETTPASVVTPAAPVVTPAVTTAAPATTANGKKTTIPALTPEEEQQQIPLRVRAEEIANELETLGGDKNLISGIRSVIANKRRIQNNDFYEGKLAELKALKGAGVQKVTEQRNLSTYFVGSKRDQSRYDAYKTDKDIGAMLGGADRAIQQLTSFINNLGYAVADVNNATPDKRALFAKNLMSQIGGSASRALVKHEAVEKGYKSASVDQQTKALINLQQDVVAAERYVNQQEKADATQVRQVTEGGEQQRQGTGEQVPADGEDRVVTTQEQKGGGEAGRGNQPVESGAQPQAAVTEEADRNEAIKVAKGNFETAIDQVNDPAYNGDIDLAFEAYRQNTADTLGEQGKKSSIDYADREFSRLVKEYKSKQPKPAPAPAPAAPAIDPVVQARVKERINKAYEDGALDIEDVVALTEMADQGNLMGAITQMKKIAESNKGAGAGAKYSLSRTAEPTTITRDFAYAKLKTVDDLNKDVRGLLARQGSTETFTAKRVPIGDLAGKVPGIPAMQRIADLFGKKLVYFAVEEGSIDLVDGAVLSGSDTIFVNVNSTRPHIRILGHEMVHALRFGNKKLYAQLVTQLTPYLDQAGMSRYRQIMAQEGVKDQALVLEEAIADIVGDRFGESSFWQMMADDNPTMFQQLARVVLNFLDSVAAKLRGNQTLDSKNLLTDIAAARQAVVSVLSTFEQQQPVVEKPAATQPAPQAAPAPEAQAGEIMLSRKREGETFYSAMERGFESVKQASMPAQQWKAWLNSNKEKLGIKKAEIEWTGINEWLDLQQGKIEKQDILNWIAGNKVKLNDIILNAKNGLTDDQLYDYVVAIGEDPDSMTRDDMVSAVVDHYGWKRSRVEGTKHRQYTEPGGDDSTYTEIVLVDPTATPYKINDKVHFGVESKGKAIGWIRSIVRKDMDGNDVLFLEEIQSQRGQEGRDAGFTKSEEMEKTLYGRWLDAVKNKDVESSSKESFDKWFVNQPEFMSQEQADTMYGMFVRGNAVEFKASDKVPTAPFVEDTKAWTGLLLKRAIAFAQTQGINRIAWTTGEQQVERYKLSKSIDELLITKNENGTFNVLAKKNNSEVINQSSLTEKELSKTVGKGLSAKAMESGEELRLVGEEMDVGGEGVSYYYNTTVPSVAKTIVGKDSVSVMELEDTGDQLGFVIPDALQEQVTNDGFPMFSRKRYEEQFSDVSPDTRERALKKGFYSPPTIKERLEHIKPNFWMRIVQGTFDKFRSVKEISNKAYLMLRMSTGSQDGAVSTLLHYGQVFNDDGALNVKKGTQGLLEILDPVGGEVDRFLLWIAANRAASLSKDERERFFSPEDIKALRALNLGTMKDGKSRVGVYAETLKNMNELNRSVLDVARDTGLIDAEGYRRFSADIWYIPFYRQMEDDGSLSAAQTSSGSVGQYLSKKLKGSDRPLNDLMENVLMNWTHILSASMKNQAAVETLTAATEQGDIVTKLDAQEKGAVKVMIKGQETYYRIDDEFLLASLSAVSQMPSYGWGMDIMRGFKTTLTRFISLSPTFKINNLIRDSIQSIGLSELSGNPIGNVMQGWRAYKDDRAEALAGGGLFAMGNAFDGDQSASVKRLLKTGVNKADILDTQDKVANFFRTMQDKYDEVSDASENANRLALYQQLRASGASHLEASYAARDLQDFGLQGSWAAIRYAAQVLPYFNARLQGMYKLGRDGIDPTMQVLTGNASDTERQKAAKFATVTGAVVAVGLLLYLTQKDDEDWKKREDWDRDAFFWFKVPGTDKAVRIPKPFEMGAIATLFERSTEQMIDSSVEGKVFAKRLGAVLHDTFAINPIPQAIRPLYDIARNKDGFTDRPIESMGMERISPQFRKSPGTSAAAVSLNTVNNMFAQFASAATGGAIKPESVQFSAIQYDYMIKGYLGWVGAGIQTASNMMATPFKDGASPRYERIDDFLVVGNYVKTVPQAQSRYVTSFYENSKDIATAASDVSHFLNAGQLEKANELFTEKQDKLALVKLYNKGTNMMSGISSQIRMVEEDKEMSGAEKRLEIERLQQIRINIAKQVEEIRINQKK